MTWALVLALAAVLVTGMTVAALAFLLGPTLTNPAAVTSSLIGALAAVCGVLTTEMVMVVLFLVGFYNLHAGRHEYGLQQERSLERALVFFIIFIVMSLVSFAYSAFSSLLQTGIPVTGGSLLVGGNIVFGPIAAFFAGLTLFYMARVLAEPHQEGRLRVAVVLGVAGAVAGPALLIVAGATNPTDLPAYTSGLLASAIAGQGISALSLLLFALVFSEVRRNLQAGKPMPVLPRYEQVYPWAYTPYGYGYPYGGPPPPPPSP